MKRVCALVLLTVMSNLAMAETIRLASGEWPPFCSQGLKHQGMGSHIITEAFAYEGIKVHYEFLPWARGHELARANKLDGIVFYSRNPERELSFHFSDPILTVDKVFFHLKSFAFEWQNMDDLKDVQIGATIDYDFGDDFREAEQTGVIKVERIATDIANLQKLLSGRIQVFPTMVESGYATLLQEFPDDLTRVRHHPKSVQNTELHIMFPKLGAKSLRLAEKFNSGLKKLKDSGRYDQFFELSRAGGYLIGNSQ